MKNSFFLNGVKKTWLVSGKEKRVAGSRKKKNQKPLKKKKGPDFGKNVRFGHNGKKSKK